jgi:hypothetical protein
MPTDWPMLLSLVAVALIPLVAVFHFERGDRERIIEHVAEHQGEFIEAVEIPIGGGPFNGYRLLQRTWLVRWKDAAGAERQSWMRAAVRGPDEWEDP